MEPMLLAVPFRSEKQRRFMFARHPKIARRWADEEKAEGSRSARREALRRRKRR